MSRGLTRRWLLAALATSPVGASISGCASGGPAQPPPAPTATPPQCVRLEGHAFRRMERFCAATPPRTGNDLMTPIDFFGPLIVTLDTVTTFYIDAVAEFDSHSGKLVRLLAPRRSDSRLFAARNDLAVTPRCDGVLVVHRGGCQVAELIGHTIPAGVEPADVFAGLHFVDDSTLVSLGADRTLRRWDVTRAELLATRHLEGDAADARLLQRPGAAQLMLSRPDSITTLRADTLDPVGRAGPFAPSRTGWLAIADGTFAGISADPGRRGLLLRTPGSPLEEFVDTHDSPESFAVSAQGALAAIVGPFLHLRTPAGELVKQQLGQPLYQVAESVFSPDGAVLFAQDAHRGLRAIDVATGQEILAFERRV